MSTKETNPKDAIGTAKVPFSTIPAQVMAETGLALMEGALKYGRHNYRTAGVRASVYYDAALRHLTAFWEGQNVDPDSGLPHLVKAIACLTVLRDSQIQGNWTDDRPPATPGEWVQDLNLLAKDLLERYPNPLPAHTALDLAKAVGDLRSVPCRWMLNEEPAPVTLDEPVSSDREYLEEELGLRTFTFLNDEEVPLDVRIVRDQEGDIWHRISRFCDSDTWTCNNPNKSITDEWSSYFIEVIV